MGKKVHENKIDNSIILSAYYLYQEAYKLIINIIYYVWWCCITNKVAEIMEKIYILIIFMDSMRLIRN